MGNTQPEKACGTNESSYGGEQNTHVLFVKYAHDKPSCIPFVSTEPCNQSALSPAIPSALKNESTCQQR